MDSGNRWRTFHDETDRKEGSHRSGHGITGDGILKPEQPKFAENVFLAGDADTGASLVVRAWQEDEKRLQK